MGNGSYVAGRGSLSRCDGCGEEIPGSTHGNYKWCESCMEARNMQPYQRQLRRESAKTRKAVIRARQRLYDTQITHWNIKDGEDALRKKFPDVFEREVSENDWKQDRRQNTREEKERKGKAQEEGA